MVVVVAVSGVAAVAMTVNVTAAFGVSMCGALCGRFGAMDASSWARAARQLK